MDRIDIENVIGLVAVVGIFLIPTLWIIASTMLKMHRVSQMTTLKLRLLEMGMSSQEVVRVCNAGLLDAEEACSKPIPKPKRAAASF